MAYTVTEHSFEELLSLKSDLNHLDWSSIFVLPHWLKTWWQTFGDSSALYLCSVKEDENTIGIAPLMIKENKARFIGNKDVCDYIDFVIAPEKENEFFSALLDDFKQKNITQLWLESLRYDSKALLTLIDIARERGYEVVTKLKDVSLDLELPNTWEEYLQMLTPKQRREIQRKLRRLYEAGDIEYRSIEGIDGLQSILDIFFKQHRESREDKAIFMTAQMESFFRSIVETMGTENLLRFGTLELDKHPIAVVMCFDYNSKLYLYNSGYDTRYSFLSVGLLSKVLSIKDSIERGLKCYDFLKGAEEYKYRLAGKEIPIYSCRIDLK